eukprot:scaffold17_cov354-Pavlova_lutheri.AAC.26
MERLACAISVGTSGSHGSTVVRVSILALGHTSLRKQEHRVDRVNEFGVHTIPHAVHTTAFSLSDSFAVLCMVFERPRSRYNAMWTILEVLFWIPSLLFVSLLGSIPPRATSTPITDVPSPPFDPIDLSDRSIRPSNRDSPTISQRTVPMEGSPVSPSDLSDSPNQGFPIDSVDIAITAKIRIATSMAARAARCSGLFSTPASYRTSRHRSGMQGRAMTASARDMPSMPDLPDVKVVSQPTVMEASGASSRLLAIATAAKAWEQNEKDVFESSLLLSDAQQRAFAQDVAMEQRFRGKAGSQASARASWASKTHVMMVGVDEKGGEAELKKMGSTVANQAKACRAHQVQVEMLPSGEEELLWDDAKVKGFVLGATTGCFQDERFKTKKGKEDEPEDDWKLELVELVVPEGAENEKVQRAVSEATAIAHGMQLARGLVSAPANYVTPAQLAETAREIAQSHPETMSLKVLEREECEQLGMGSYLAVAEASDEPPKFIHLTYKPRAGGGAVQRKLGLVGKGLTFDSGGYNIKAGPGSMIELMKFDMGGAAATLGAAKTVAELEPPNVEVHFIVAACENMVAGRGMRPGDIITASNGKTIEVNNTDAEGRLTLADALIYAENQGVERCLDIATLTGACIVALGDKMGGLFTQDDEVADLVAQACKQVGEKFWRMPMEPAYKEQLKSLVADMKNTGTRAGGSITAALFLSEYVKEMKWGHLDIAGPVWDEKQGGATGFGAATLSQWVLDASKES